MSTVTVRADSLGRDDDGDLACDAQTGQLAAEVDPGGRLPAMQGVRGAIDPVAAQQRPKNGCATLPVHRVRNVSVLLANLVAIAVEPLCGRGQDPQVGIVEGRVERL